MSEYNLTDSWITSSAALLKLPLDPAWLPSIRANVEVTFRLAKLVDDFQLPDEAEPAPVFEA
jgi:hypothetical protein